MRTSGHGVLGVLVVVAIAAPAAAQETNDSEVRHRNECRLAAQVLSTGHPHPRYAWAHGKIGTCADEGPAYFAAEWNTVPADTALLRELIGNSTRWRDARIHARLRETAADRTRSDAVRVAAMIALAGYVDPYVAIDLADLRPPAGPIERIRFYGGTGVHAVQMPGAQPVGSVTSEVLALLNGIARDRVSEPREVWYAAAALARRLELDLSVRGR